MPDSNVKASSYRVLARKYRPDSFDGLIGQEAMVKTLTNAIRTARLAHAFVLTGVRGVGKTTTARILARALNCTGPDGKGGPAASPCGQCEHCRAIAEGNHVDVLEMDAASRTGVENIRELLDGVRYRPVMARTKVYIIDEVHMLSTQAFNALLKTLEEPPSNVTFIFATTETRKVPVTVLSRCQRFDLRRVDVERLTEHFADIAKKEGANIEETALQLIARAADGSVRDGLSLLDQAIAFGGETVTADMVREMLGLAERLRIFDLFDAVMAGDVAGALDELDQAYATGADPLIVLQDLLELTHWLTRIKVVPKTAEGFGVPEAERSRGTAMAAKLSLAELARVWQMLLKGVEEVRFAAAPLKAAEMVLIRLAYASDLPDPATLVKTLTEKEKGETSPARNPGPSGVSARAPAPTLGAAPATEASGRLATRTASKPEPAPRAAAHPMPTSFPEAVDLFRERREPILHAHLMNNVHLVHFEPGRIEFHPGPHAPANLASRLGELLSEWTGERWILSVVSSQEGEPTLRAQEETKAAAKREEAAQHPLVRAVKEAFPKATIETIHPVAETLPDAAAPREENEEDPA
ncbi:MAG: DNA polymerase III subunit gamma/tau [Alphaproteobacteria bacterium]|nr:DNA polymerase III subunit gamma/tau [Alphaproteobacteria bacterium]